MKWSVSGINCNRVEVVVLGNDVVIPEPGKYVVQCYETEEIWYCGFEDYEAARSFASEDDYRYLYSSTPELWEEAVKINAAAQKLKCLMERGEVIAAQKKAKKDAEAAQIAAENAEIRDEFKMLGIKTRY